jgi:hypothetical protein
MARCPRNRTESALRCRLTPSRRRTPSSQLANDALASGAHNCGCEPRAEVYTAVAENTKMEILAK